jgi:hypothetical protein
MASLPASAKAEAKTSMQPAANWQTKPDLIY